jgi:hypothetical protein
MRKSRAKILRKLAKEQAEQPEYLHMIVTNPKLALGMIEKKIKILWYNGRI